MPRFIKFDSSNPEQPTEEIHINVDAIAYIEKLPNYNRQGKEAVRIVLTSGTGILIVRPLNDTMKAIQEASS